MKTFGDIPGELLKTFKRALPRSVPDYLLCLARAAGLQSRESSAVRYSGQAPPVRVGAVLLNPARLEVVGQVPDLPDNRKERPT